MIEVTLSSRHRIRNSSTGVEAFKSKDLTPREKAMTTVFDTGGKNCRLLCLIHIISTLTSKKQQQQNTTEKPPQVGILQRIAQVLAIGGDVNVQELIDNEECLPRSLFDTSGDLRNGVKSTLTQIMVEETNVRVEKNLAAFLHEHRLVSQAPSQLHGVTSSTTSAIA